MDEIQVSWRSTSPGGSRRDVGVALLEDAGRVASGGTVSVDRGCRICGSQDHGAPYFGGGISRFLGCSLTYTSGLAVAAVTVRRTAGGAGSLRRAPLPVGIDAEALLGETAPGDLHFARRILTTGEQALLRIGGSSPHLDLVQLWTAKEAVLKATGWGLALDPRVVDASSSLCDCGDRLLAPRRSELMVDGVTEPFTLWQCTLDWAGVRSCVCVASPSTARAWRAVVRMIGELP